MALSPDLATWLRSRGHDAVHATELAMNRAADTQILSLALEAGRVVISADLDFPGLLLRSGNYSESQSLECVWRERAAVGSLGGGVAHVLLVGCRKRVSRY
jgi:predicted nuclease of predicted toxin-antitoxin system